MKKSKFLIPIILVVLLIIWGVKVYNRMVTQDETVNTAWSQVENQYQRRLDLIPNLVNTVKGYAAHERETLEGVVEARAKASKTEINANNMTAAELSKFQQTQDQLSQALSKLMVVVERYPDLKANENFLQLQSQLEGTENRISVERKRFNEAAKGYNVLVRRFPNNLFAGLFGFGEKPYFEATQGAEQAPKVEF